jgi:solute carrier family 25 protein 34/35
VQVKTQLQARSTQEIAVGHQHGHKGMVHAIQHIYENHGIRGLWRGVNGQVPRLMVRRTRT